MFTYIKNAWDKTKKLHVHSWDTFQVVVPDSQFKSIENRRVCKVCGKTQEWLGGSLIELNGGCWLDVK